MGVVNLTPDSFSGDGVVGNIDRAIAHARQQFEAGADILDIGAESSRPGAIPTSEKDELQRLLPVLKEITCWGVPVSVDTYKPAVMRAALESGAAMINDITGMTNQGALAAIARAQRFVSGRAASCASHSAATCHPSTACLAPLPRRWAKRWWA